MGWPMSSKSIYISEPIGQESRANLLAFTWLYPRLLGRKALHTPRNFSPSHTETRSNYIFKDLRGVGRWGVV